MFEGKPEAAMQKQEKRKNDRIREKPKTDGKLKHTARRQERPKREITNYGIRFHAMKSSQCVNNGTFQKKFSTLTPAPS